MRAGIGNETMTGKRIDATSTAARYDALIRVSEALRGYHDREALFRQSRHANCGPSSGSAFWA